MKNGSKFIGKLMVFLMAVLLFGSIAFAENSLELHQTGATASSIQAHFIDAGGGYNYRILYRVHSDNGDGDYIDLGTYSYNTNIHLIYYGTITIENLDPGTRYDLKLEVIKKSDKTSYFTPHIVAITAPKTNDLTIEQTKATETSASFIVRGAGGLANEYKVKYYPAKDKKAFLEKTFYSEESEFENVFSIDGLKPDTKYCVEITACFRGNFIDPSVTDSEQAFIAKGKTQVFDKNLLQLIPSTPVEGLYQYQRDYQNVYKTISVAWHAKGTVDGYQVSLLDYDLETNIKSIDTGDTYITIPVNECGFYKVEVRPYITFNGEHHFGPSSEKVIVSTKCPEHSWIKKVEKEPTVDKNGYRLFSCEFCPATNKEIINKIGYPAKVSIKGIKANKGSITINWKIVSGVDGYAIYRLDQGSKTYELLKIINKQSAVLWVDKNRLKKGKSYAYKIKAYRIYNNKKIYSKSFSRTVKVVAK